MWRGVRAAEGAALEMLCTPQAYRGFKSPPLRQNAQNRCTTMVLGGFICRDFGFYAVLHTICIKEEKSLLFLA